MDQGENKLISKLKKLLFLKMKFALSSSVATGVDYVLYLSLVHNIFSPVPSNIISASCGMIVNFILQKKFVFDLKRSVRSAFLLSVLVSVGGITLGTTIVYLLSNIPFFNLHQYITKICATGIVFFYNFYLKRFVFEKQFI